VLLQHENHMISLHWVALFLFEIFWDKPRQEAWIVEDHLALLENIVAVNILKLLYELLRLLVAGIRSIDWVRLFIKCVELLCCLIAYMGLSLAIILLMLGLIMRLIHLFFLFYLCLSPRWRALLLSLTPIDPLLGTIVASETLQLPSSSIDQLSSGEEPLVIFKKQSISHLPYSCRLMLFFVIPLSRAWGWFRGLWPIPSIIAKCHFWYRWLGLKTLRRNLWRFLRWLKLKTRIFTRFRINVKKTQRGNGITLELDYLFNKFSYIGLRLTHLRTGSFNYGLKSPRQRTEDINSLAAAFLFLSVIFLFICWNIIILLIFNAAPF